MNKAFHIIRQDKVNKGRVTLIDDPDTPRDMTTITITGPRAFEVAEQILQAEQMQAELDRTKKDVLTLRSKICDDVKKSV